MGFMKRKKQPTLYRPDGDYKAPDTVTPLSLPFPDHKAGHVRDATNRDHVLSPTPTKVSRVAKPKSKRSKTK